MTAVDDYTSILQTTLLERTRRNMEHLVPEKTPAAPLPFALTPAFFDLYNEVYRLGVFPLLISRRPVKQLQNHYDWSKDALQQLNTIMEDRTNPIFVAWDYAWDAMWDERTAPREPTVRKGAKEKKSLLASLTFWKKDSGKGAKSQSEPEQQKQPMEGLHKMLVQHAERKGYMPLLYDDLKVFKGLIRVHPNRIREAYKEITQFHNQEFMFASKEQTKPGATSDAMTKWMYTLPDRVGEFLVLKAAVDLEHINKAFLQKYIRQAARTQEDAERAMPYLAAYWKAMTHTVTR